MPEQSEKHINIVSGTLWMKDNNDKYQKVCDITDADIITEEPEPEPVVKWVKTPITADEISFDCEYNLFSRKNRLLARRYLFGWVAKGPIRYRTLITTLRRQRLTEKGRTSLEYHRGIFA